MWGWGAVHYIQWAPEMSFLCAHLRTLRTWGRIRNRVCASFQALPYPNERCVCPRNVLWRQFNIGVRQWLWTYHRIANENWWRHDIETLSALLALGELIARPMVGFSHNGPVMRRFDDELIVIWGLCHWKMLNGVRAWINNHIHIFYSHIHFLLTHA